MPHDLTAQIACVERELALRRRLYPRFIRLGKLDPNVAAHELLTMQAVLQTLRALQPQHQEELPYAAPRA